MYHFFGSKEDLIEAAQAERSSRSLRESTAEFLMQMDGISDAAGFREACRQSMVRYFGAAGAHHRLVRINALGSGHSSPICSRRSTMRSPEPTESSPTP